MVWLWVMEGARGMMVYGGMVLGDGGWETTEPVRTEPQAPPRHRCDQWHMTQLCSQTVFIQDLCYKLVCVCVDKFDQWHMTLTRFEGDFVPGAANDTSQGCPGALLPII